MFLSFSAATRLVVVYFCLLGVPNFARADVWLDYQWGEGMVMQSGVPALLHGTAKAGENVTIAFRSTTLETRADKFGQWKVAVEPGKAGGPFELDIKGDMTPAAKQISLKDVHVSRLTLASVFGDGMVLQRGASAPLFGTTEPGAAVTAAFRGQAWETKADASGAWRIDIEPGEAGGPFSLTITGAATLQLKDVYVGEVWVCSGQSNMRWGVSYTKDYHALPLERTNPLLRMQMYPELSYAPNHPVGRFAGWQQADKKAVLAFSATGYYFGVALQEKLRVPVGLIQAAVDATSIREWLPGDKVQELKLGPASDGGHYARRIRPLQPIAIRGVIWYQGEADAGKDVFGVGYDRRLAALIQGWRRDWGQGDFPFLYVQLPRLGFGAEQVHGGKLPTDEQKRFVGDWARVIGEQRQVLDVVPNTAMAVYYDHTTGLLHPAIKKPAGDRLALAARALAYGEKIEYSGPLATAARKVGDEIVIAFTHAAGLVSREGPPRQFEVAGPDGEFASAPARIDGMTVRLNAATKAPRTVRYAYRQWPDGNLFNAAGLPASPFQMSIEP